MKAGMKAGKGRAGTKGKGKGRNEGRKGANKKNTSFHKCALIVSSLASQVGEGERSM